MALPPGFLDEIRDRVTLSDVVARKVTWDRRKSNPARGDFWAPCPFHQEKTASFHVEDRKGFYYCFGCHAKGDAITFLREADNLSFMEAVERLASEAGMEMPKTRDDPKAAERRDRETRLVEVMEMAVRAFGMAFRGAQGTGARDYAKSRGLEAETLARFEIGFAPDARHFLTDQMREKGVLEEAVAAGLVIRPEDGGAPYDRFRGRLMFPIRDGRGRCIAFGGRALSPDAQAKYLNSPETEIFSKGKTLYNIGPARTAAGKSGQLVVAEGYMDVVALVQAGIEHAVAPLGTAVTEDQLQLLWRMAPEPVMALDGDKAGLRAAMRVVDLALPHLAPGRSLGFCLMPEGADPDDLIKTGGVAAMEAAIEGALPMVEMLWRREVEAGPLETPERRAALDQRLGQALERIADRGVRAHYRDALRMRRAELFRPPRPPSSGSGPGPARMSLRGSQGLGRGSGRGGGLGGGRGGHFAIPQGPVAETRATWLAREGAPQAAARLREATILAILVANLALAPEMEAEIEELPLSDPAFERLRAAILDAIAEPEPTRERLAETLAEALGGDPEEILASFPQARAHPQARPGLPAAEVRPVLAEAIARHRTALSLDAERAEARAAFAEADGEDWTWRLRQVAQERASLDRQALAEAAPEEDPDESVIGRLLEDQVYATKKRRKPPSNQ